MTRKDEEDGKKKLLRTLIPLPRTDEQINNVDLSTWRFFFVSFSCCQIFFVMCYLIYFASCLCKVECLSVFLSTGHVSWVKASGVRSFEGALALGDLTLLQRKKMEDGGGSIYSHHLDSLDYSV